MLIGTIVSYKCLTLHVSTTSQTFLSTNVKYIDTVTDVYNDIGLLLKSISSSFNGNINYASLPHYLIAVSVG